MAEFSVIDAQDAPLLPGMTLRKMQDGTYRILVPGEVLVEEWGPGRSS